MKIHIYVHEGLYYETNKNEKGVTCCFAFRKKNKESFSFELLKKKVAPLKRLTVHLMYNIHYPFLLCAKQIRSFALSTCLPLLVLFLVGRVRLNNCLLLCN